MTPINKRFITLALGLTSACTIMLFTSQTAVSQGGVKNLVWLQPTSPGTAQSGHVNVSGTLKGTNGTFLTTGSNGLKIGANGSSGDTIFAGALQVTSTLATGISVETLNSVTNGVGVLSRTFSPGGTALLGWASAPNSIAVYAQASDPTAAAIFAGGHATIQDRLGIGFGTTTRPNFPIQLTNTLGSKMSLFGSTESGFYGFGIDSNTLQIVRPSTSNVVAFSYGDYGALQTTLQVEGSATLRFRPDGSAIPAVVVGSYDLTFRKDEDNNNTAWFRFYTDGGTESIRILDGDEATSLFDGAVTANGIDYAEAFKVADPSIEPGDVVSVYPGHWEFANKSSKAYDQHVIGVVSTKPAFIAGMSFNAEETIDPELTRQRSAALKAGNEKLAKELTILMQEKVKEAYRPVAFMGRVPVKVTGPVKVGDHLTSSQVPGYAMAMTQSGHSLGVALESSTGGQRKIMVLVQPKYFAAPVPNQAERMEKLEQENRDLRNRLDALERKMR